MCCQCRSSALGLERQANVDAARAALREVGIVPTPTSTLFARYGARRDAGDRPGAPWYTAQQQELWGTYLAAVTALRQLHEDYASAQMRAAGKILDMVVEEDNDATTNAT